MSDSDKKKQLSRRQAIEKLAKLSVYTAPTVTALLVAQESWAVGSCKGNMTNFPRNTNNMNFSNNGVPKDIDSDRFLSSDMGGGLNDTTQDCQTS